MARWCSNGGSVARGGVKRIYTNILNLNAQSTLEVTSIRVMWQVGGVASGWCGKWVVWQTGVAGGGMERRWCGKEMVWQGDGAAKRWLSLILNCFS